MAVRVETIGQQPPVPYLSPNRRHRSAVEPIPHAGEVVSATSETSCLPAVGIMDSYRELMAFYDERPLMHRTNCFLPLLLKLMHGENDELRDQPEKYMTPYSYWAQEVCDVINFAMAIMSAWDYVPNEARILELHTKIVGRSPLTEEIPEYAVSRAGAQAFWAMRDELDAVLAHDLFRVDVSEKNEERFIQRLLSPETAAAKKTERLINKTNEKLEIVIAYGLSMLTVLGKNFRLQMARKIRRNNEKYPAADFADIMTGDDLVSSSHSRHIRRHDILTEDQFLKGVYDLIRERLVVRYNGVKDPVTGLRPKPGDQAFYEQRRLEDMKQWQQWEWQRQLTIMTQLTKKGPATPALRLR